MDIKMMEKTNSKSKSEHLVEGPLLEAEIPMNKVVDGQLVLRGISA